MATRYTTIGAAGAAALVASSIGASLYTASSAEQARQAITAAYDPTTRHGELAVRVDAGGADVTALAGVDPGTPTQVLTVSDSGIPVWRTPASGTVTASQISDSTSYGRTLLTAASVAAQRAAMGVAGVTVYYASDCTAEAGSESASISGTGVSSTFTLGASSTARLYGTGGATASRVVCPLPAGTESAEVLVHLTAASGMSTGGWRYLGLALRDTANAGTPTTLWGVGWSDGGSGYAGNLMGGANGGPANANTGSIGPTAADKWMRVSLRPLQPGLGWTTATGSTPTAWAPPSGAINATYSGTSAVIPDVESTASAIAVWLQSFGSGGASSITGTLTIRAVLR